MNVNRDVVQKYIAFQMLCIAALSIGVVTPFVVALSAFATTAFIIHLFGDNEDVSSEEQEEVDDED